MTQSELQELVMQNAREGKVTLMTVEGLATADIDDIIKQPAEGLLYDLNRDRVTTITLIGKDPKWINDYAVAVVIEKLKTELDARDSEIKALREKAVVLVDRIFDESEPLRACGDCRKCAEELRAALVKETK